MADVIGTARFACERCEREYEPVSYRWRCPRCGHKASCCEGEALHCYPSDTDAKKPIS